MFSGKTVAQQKRHQLCSVSTGTEAPATLPFIYRPLAYCVICHRLLWAPVLGAMSAKQGRSTFLFPRNWCVSCDQKCSSAWLHRHEVAAGSICLGPSRRTSLQVRSWKAASEVLQKKLPSPNVNDIDSVRFSSLLQISLARLSNQEELAKRSTARYFCPAEAQNGTAAEGCCEGSIGSDSSRIETVASIDVRNASSKMSTVGCRRSFGRERSFPPWRWRWLFVDGSELVAARIR